MDYLCFTVLLEVHLKLAELCIIINIGLRGCLVAGLDKSCAGIKFCINNVIFGSWLGVKLFMYKINIVSGLQFRILHN